MFFTSLEWQVFCSTFTAPKMPLRILAISGHRGQSASS